MATELAHRNAHPKKGRHDQPAAIRDRVAAERMLDDLVRKAERGDAGIPDRESVHQPLGPLLEEFREVLGRKSGKQHVTEVVHNARRMLEAAGIGTLAEVRKPEASGLVESAVWALLKGDDAVLPPTAAKAGKHVRQFTRWLWRKKKLLDHDPLAGVDIPSQETENPRRPFTPEEVARLIQAAQESVNPFRGLAGPDRAILYLTACATGYRAGELAKLTPTHFDLDAEVPVARMDRKRTKNKKAAEQPIPPAVARQLREYFVGKLPKEPVWPGTWWDRAADMLKDDLAAAGIAVETEEGAALFHSLKHTYTTMLAQVAPVKVTQELSRHSTPVLTLGRYTHAGMAEKAEAVGKLPLPGSEVARGPFSGMPRAELESVAETLLILVASLCGADRTPRRTPRRTPDAGNSGDSLGPTGTKEPARHPPGRKKKPL